jgi:hypothetical protein
MSSLLRQALLVVCLSIRRAASSTSNLLRVSVDWMVLKTANAARTNGHTTLIGWWWFIYLWAWKIKLSEHNKAFPSPGILLSAICIIFWRSYIRNTLALFPKGKHSYLWYSYETPTIYQNDLALRNIADVTSGKPIAVWSQLISGVSAVNPVVSFYGFHERKGGVLFFCSVTTRNVWQSCGYDCKSSVHTM